MEEQKEHKYVQQELEALSPTLARLKSAEKPVAAPAYYFELLTGQVLDRIRQQEEATQGIRFHRPLTIWGKLSDLFRQPAYGLALAALLLLLLALPLWLLQAGPGQSNALTLSEEEINTYIDQYLDDFDLGLLVEEADWNEPGTEVFTEEDSLREEEMQDFFDELLDDVYLEELL